MRYLSGWLNVTESGYYAWRERPESAHAQKDKEMCAEIIEIYQKSKGIYGSPRVYKALKEQGIKVGKKRVERLMRSLGLRGRVVKVTRQMPKFKRFIASGENLLKDAAPETQINQVWVADITYLKVKGRHVYLTTIMDRYSRRILGWGLSTSRTVNDTLKVLKRVIKKRQPPEGMIFHTDRGIEFTGLRFRQALKDNEIEPSLNRAGKCTDNAHMESFYHSLKAELIRGRRYNTIEQLRSSLNIYINHFYNHNRMHSGIEYCTPVKYEQMAA